MEVTLRPEVVEWLQHESSRTGVPPEDLVARRIETQWATAARFPVLSEKETDLLAQINEGLPPAFWEPYRALIQRRDAGVLTSAEQATLIALSDEVEEKNLRRTQCLIALAQMRRTSLEDLIAELGLTPAPVNPPA